MWNLKHDTNEHICKIETDSDIESSLVVAEEEGYRGGMEWEVGVSRCKLLYTEWISNKVLLYSTGRYSQYSMINHNGKEY